MDPTTEGERAKEKVQVRFGPAPKRPRLVNNELVVEEREREREKREYIVAIENSQLSTLHSEPVEEELVIPLPSAHTDMHTQAQAVTATKTETEREGEKKTLSLEEQAAREILRELSGEGENKDASDATIIALQGSDNNNNKKKKTLLADLTERLKVAANEDERFKVDMTSRAEDLSVKSTAYEAIPIEKFGAAMLRGMGWAGETKSGKEKEKEESMQNKVRPARLGLGASDALRKATQVDTRKASSSSSSVCVGDRKSEKSLRFGDIVKVRVDAERVVAKLARSSSYVFAKVIATDGIPGLNKIRVQVERTTELVDITVMNAQRTTSADLEDYRPHFPELKAEQPSSSSSSKRDREETTVTTSTAILSERSSSQKDVQKKGQVSSASSKAPERWLRTGIRVKLVSKSYGDKAYLRKGFVVDVPTVGIATIKFDNGTLLNEVRERHLETVLPRTGGHCLVLSGSNKGQLATLLQFDKLARIQLAESLEIIELDPDCIAECDQSFAALF